MALGERVAVNSEQLAGAEGVVMDADFIHSRVQLQIDDTEEPQWVSFKRIGSIL